MKSSTSTKFAKTSATGPRSSSRSPPTPLDPRSKCPLPVDFRSHEDFGSRFFLRQKPPRTRDDVRQNKQHDANPGQEADHAQPPAGRLDQDRGQRIVACAAIDEADD